MSVFSRSRLRRRAAVTGLGSAAAVALVLAPTASAVTGTSDLTTLTATQVTQALVGPGVTIANVTHVGAAASAGTFAGGAASIGFDSGVILASGAVANAIGPNTADNAMTQFGTAGDADLAALAGFATNDASVLELDFTPNGDTVYFRYVFASEEYNEYVNSQYNDTFAFFVNGVNCATVDTGAGLQPVSINTINNGSPYGSATATNPSLFVNNDLDDGGGALNTQYDGMTVALTCMAPVNTGVPNHLKLAIADGSDYSLDSGVFLEQGSLSTTPPAGDGKVTGGGRLDFADGAVTLGTSVIDDEQGLRGNLQVNDHRDGTRFHGSTVTAFSRVDTTATWSGEGRLNGVDGYTYTAEVVDNRNGNATTKGSPDTVMITVRDAADVVVWSTMSAIDLNRGNITVHLG
ncbi:choice-of-anchor L domain-containing protein [Janibacter sp. G1551]|uniref:choice-of-anchor L domain-containing protein n=1 Tax=Janibacter sp. G1551 TaxID=3420440 RepID=UPI003CFEB8EB